MLENPERGLRQIKFDMDIIHLRIYSDGRFANNRDLTSHLGYKIFAGDSKNALTPISYRSYKSIWVARSVLGAETCSFPYTLDQFYSIKLILEKSNTRPVSMRMTPEYKSLFNFIFNVSNTIEKRLFID